MTKLKLFFKTLFVYNLAVAGMAIMVILIGSFIMWDFGNIGLSTRLFFTLRLAELILIVMAIHQVYFKKEIK